MALLWKKFQQLLKEVAFVCFSQLETTFLYHSTQSCDKNIQSAPCMSKDHPSCFKPGFPEEHENYIVMCYV